MKQLRIFSIIFFVAVSHISFAQTKKIMHRSHSGGDASFSTDESEDNFGITRAMEIHLDSINTFQEKMKKDSIDAAKNKKNKADTIKKTNPQATVPKKPGVKSKNQKKK